MQGKNLQGHEIKRRYKQSFSPDFMKSGNALSVFCDLYILLAAQD